MSREAERLNRELGGLINSLTGEVLTLSQHRSSSLFTQQENIFAITGHRGGGKSTVLKAVCEQVARQKRSLVLPIIEPELFVNSESVIGALLAELWDMLIDGRSQAALDARDVTPDEQAERLAMNMRLINETARTAAIARSDQGSPATGGARASALADDIVTAARATARLETDLGRLISTTLLGLNQPGPIVVPIDDADLAYGSLREILQELRLLSRIDGIAIIACFNREDLFDTLYAEWKSVMPHVDDSRMRTNVNQQITKLFPLRRLFSIPVVSEDRRQSFSPLGTRKSSIGDKIKQLEDQLRAQTSDFEPSCDLRSLVTSGKDDQLPVPLPGNPRQLTQMWDSLDASMTKDRDSSQLRLAASRIAEVLSYEVPSLTLEDVAGLFSNSDVEREGARRQLGSRYAAGCATTDAWPEDSAGLASVSLRRFSRVTGQLTVAEASGRDSQRARERTPMSPQALSALLGVLELNLAWPASSLSGDLCVSTGEYIFLQRVTFSGFATDDHFFTLPPSYSLSAIRRTVTCWNNIARIQKQSALTPSELSRVVISASLALGFGNTPSLSDLREAASQSMEFLVEQAGVAYEQSQGSQSEASTAFRRWYQYFMPCLLHSRLVDHLTLRTCVASFAQRASVSRSLGSLEDTAFEFFDARIERLISDIDEDNTVERAWVSGYFELANALGSTWLNHLAALAPSFEDQSSVSRAGAAALGKTTVRTSSSKRAMAPYETPAGTALANDARRALRRLRSTQITS